MNRHWTTSRKHWVWREHQGDNNLIRIARWSVGRALRSLNRIEAALKVQQDLLAEYKAIGETDGFVFEEMAECLLLLERSTEAKPYFAQAYNELSQIDWLAASEPERIQRLQQLSQ